MKLQIRRAALCAALIAGVVSSPAAVPSTSIVISQIYGGGGNTGALYTHDFIELFNRGSVAVSLDGLSLQYASATGTGNLGATATQLTELPAVVLQPGQYFLVQEGTGAGNGGALPAPDWIDTSAIAMSATAGKVALVAGTTSLGCNGGSAPCSAAQLARIVDLVGFGSANFFETAPTPALTNSTAAARHESGCAETDNNAADFSVAPPAPRTTASPVSPCQGGAVLSIADVSVTEGDSGVTNATFTVTLSSPAPAGGVTFDIATADGTATLADNDYTAVSAAAVIAGGGTGYTFDVAVTGDMTVEPAETFVVNITNITGAAAGRTQAIATIANDDVPPPIAIHAIQGPGAATPFAGQDVVTTGIVTARKSNGFFLQTPDAAVDADPNSSEGIFIFTSTLPTVAIGDAVRVRGTATEYFDLTEISTTLAEVVVLSSGNILPAPVTLTTDILTPAGSNLEPFEGMRMHAASLVSVSPTNRFGETLAVLAGVPRPMREPGIPASLPVPPDPSSGTVDCCIPRWDENPEQIVVDSDGLYGATSTTVTSNVTFASVTGPLDFTFGAFKLLPEALEPSPNMAAVAAPVPTPGEFTVAGFNIENFRNNETQRRKAALAIRSVMRYPDVIGHVEIFDLASLEALAAQVNDDAMAAGEPNPQYEARLIPAAEGTQHVGFLVRTSRVSIVSVTQERASETYINPNTGLPETLHDRPPLVLKATFGPSARPVIVVVNHLRSFIDAELLTPEGGRVRAKRTAQAESLAGLLQELQLANPTTPVISVGDYNAYEFNDGYTDPIAIITGQPTPDEQIVVDASPDLVDPNFVNLTGALPAAERYTFVHEGTPQALDHVIVSTVARSYLTRYAIARANADFPEVPAALFASDPTRPERSSDHDMPVAYFDFTAPSILGLAATPGSLGPPNHAMVDVTLAYSATDDNGPVVCAVSVASNEAANALGDGNTEIDWQVLGANRVRLRAERSGTGSGRVYTVTVTCSDSTGNSSSASVPVTVKK